MIRNEDVPLCHSFHYMNKSGELVVVQCGRVVGVQLEGPLDGADSLAESGSMSNHCASIMKSVDS
jgi:hypothetical protein